MDPCSETRIYVSKTAKFYSYQAKEVFDLISRKSMDPFDLLPTNIQCLTKSKKNVNK